MKIEAIGTNISGLILIKLPVHADERGYFTEIYNAKVFNTIDIHDSFCQDNLSKSSKNVLRGLHFQHPPFSQAKLVRVLSGRIQDVVVDIRKNSPTFGKYYMCELTDNNLQLYVPEGFAHGFLSLEDDTIVSYKCSNYYHKLSEDGLMWNDMNLNIQWFTSNPILSDKDTTYQSFNQFLSPF